MGTKDLYFSLSNTALATEKAPLVGFLCARHRRDRRPHWRSTWRESDPKYIQLRVQSIRSPFRGAFKLGLFYEEHLYRVRLAWKNS